MPKHKEQPSHIGETIRVRINAIIGINQHSNYKVADIINKSETYVRQHRNGHNEWTIGDLERYGKATGYTISDLTARTFTLKPAA